MDTRALPLLAAALLVAALAASALAARADPLPRQLPRLAWNAQWRNGQLQAAPVLTCLQACALRFELATLGNPAQRLRQGGELALGAGESRGLGRLALSAPGPHCRLGVTLWHRDGFEEHYETDPCAP